MAVYTKIEKKDLNYIQNFFKMEKILDYVGIKKGIENTNYLIFTKKQKYILTIFEKRVQQKELPYFMNLMSQLSKHKINCPRPLQDPRGRYLFKIKNKKGCVVTFLKGKDKIKLITKDLYSIGKNIAKMHRVSKKIKLYRKNTFSPLNLNLILNRINKKKINKLSKNLVSEMRGTLKEIKKNWPKSLPKNIIHGDLFIDNIFFYKKKFYGFIDFYFSSNDFEAYELATCINALCFNQVKKKFFYDKNKTLQLLNGYESIRKLNNKEKNSLNILCKGSALRYLATRAYDYINTPKSAIIKKKDPREYIQKLAFHKKINSFSSYIK